MTIAGGADWLIGDSPIVELIRSKDWSETSLGPIEEWPESLRTTVSLILASSFPVNLIWGPECVQIWNESYAVVCGEKHPVDFGTDYRTCWESAWPAVGGAFEEARSGRTAYLEDQPMFLDRNGYLEETWFTFSLSPIRDERGQVAGLFHPVTETTARMLSERRTRALGELAAATGDAQNPDEAGQRALEILAGYSLDVPFALLYLADGEDPARLVAHTGVTPGTPLAPLEIPREATTTLNRVAEVMASGEMAMLDGLVASGATAGVGPHPEPPDEAFVLPITLPGNLMPSGALVLGVSPRLPHDDSLAAHMRLLVAGVTSSIANADAFARAEARAQELAELDRAKTTFFSNVSHELRTPLTLMLGPLEAMLEEARSEGDRERLEMTHRNAIRLLRMVNSLLDFSRIEAGRMDASFEPTDLGAYTRDLAGLFRSAAEQAGLELHVRTDELPAPVFVDRTMWEKLVVNLLSNALKYTFEGAIDVALQARDGRVELSVTDSGVGISESELPKLFERFQRVNDAQSRSFEGTGIGLSLVKEIAQFHGGEVAVTSTPGQGSRFSVTLPLGSAHLPPEQVRAESDTPAAPRQRIDDIEAWVSASAASPARPAPADAAPATPSADAGPTSVPRILIADDNADMRSHIRTLLEPGFLVDTVADGAAALEHALTDPPDLILTDVMMPVMDGLELVRRLRSEAATETVPVIILSARAGEESAVEGLDAGADDYLVKPFATRELLARISAQLSLARLRQGSNERLEAANRELERAAAAKSAFLANMSHEIRTPMNAIIGMTSLILDTPLADEQRECAEIIRASGEHLLSVISDVLDFSKIDAGELVLEHARFELVDCVEQIVDLVSASATQKGLELLLEIGSQVPVTVVSDAARLRQILINLLGNAVKFTESGEVALSITAEPAPTADGRTWVHFAVRDTGIGIASADQVALFDPFTQVDATSTRAHEGTGLGLAISRRLTTLLGGEISLESTAGEGSCFTLSLPMETLPEAQAPTAPPPELQGRRMLIVDDNATSRRIISQYAKAFGMESVAVPGAVEAMDALEAGRFDVAVIDWMMPETDGPALSRAIHARADATELPLVAVSSLGANRAELGAVASEFASVLAKPVKRGTLRAALSGALGGTQIRRIERSDGSLQALAQAPIRILIVEDHRVNQIVLTRLLARLGQNPDVAADGREAVEAVMRQPYDLVLMDVQMPRLDGLAATREIRQLNPVTRPYIVGLTADVSPNAQSQCLEAGMDAYLPKPVSPEQLSELLAGFATSVS